ncbi:putative leucine-rich repeat domain, L domain-containing protein [Rosa chinensis]|uniref:Putative leucine-rich repeat domain, L domain-containing protein n=1 Tax=Rosa chinensis TaxID=74649 RepID=A0A2P6Q3D0_ROSCH|nr:disease resistance RPP13-like protein 4 [Rosa chinensis]PRQ28695.1 putative leucine-rich repeat domain, L domain-containing protein [Rosa chinensis]
MSRRPLVTTSFKTPYVSLDLLSYLKSGQVTPFQVFNDVIMPDFKDHISKGNNSPNNEEARGIVKEIEEDLDPIGKACERFQEWEVEVSSAIKDLAYQSLDDAFRERTEALESTNRANFLLNKLTRTRSIVSRLKKSVCSASIKMSDETSENSDTPQTGEELQPLKTNETMGLTEIEAIYNDLEDRVRPCLLCFSMFPEDAVIKKKVLIHWWVGEGFIDNLGAGETAEKKGNTLFKVFLDKDIVQPFYKRRRPSADSCKMQPSIRDAVIELATRENFFHFDRNGNPTEDFSCSKRACLVRTIEGSNVRELPLLSSQENVQSLINVNEHDLYFRPNWFSQMKRVKVLQLGRWHSDKHLIEVEDCEFLKGLKNMRELRYLSLRGVSRITELPASICKARNLRILNLNGCCDLEKLPRGIGSLKKLTHLDMYECYLISGMPKGLALLSNLQVLKGFVISKRSGSQDCKLDDLSKLEYLRKLSIHIDRNQAKTAERELNSLAKFKKLRSLSISWSRIYDKPATHSLQTLQRAKRITKLPSMLMALDKLPSMSKGPEKLPSIPESPLPLEKLDLHYFPHSKMPDWLKPTLLGKLKKLYIRGGSLSDLGHKKLNIGGGSLSDLCHNGINCTWTVQMVRLKFLNELKMDWGTLQGLFPELSYLEVVECPKLRFTQCDENGVWKKEDSKPVELASSSNA